MKQCRGRVDMIGRNGDNMTTYAMRNGKKGRDGVFRCDLIVGGKVVMNQQTQTDVYGAIRKRIKPSDILDEYGKRTSGREYLESQKRQEKYWRTGRD